MKIRRLLACTLWACALVVPCAAEEKAAERAPSDSEREVRRVVEVRHRELIGELTLLAQELNVTAHGSRELGVITLLGPEDAVALVEDTILRFDGRNLSQPEPSPRNADFTAYLILARLEGEAAPVPAVLDSVITQLRELLPYHRYELLETATVRVAEGRGIVSGVLPPLSPELSGRTFYDLKLQSVHLPGEDPDGPPAGWVSLDPFLQMTLSWEEGSFQRNASIQINTHIEIREGQKVVVGKATVDSAGTSLILVLTMRLDG